MAKTWVAVGVVAAIGAAALTISTPASAHWRGEAAGTVIAGDYDSSCYGRPRGLFNFGYSGHCGCTCTRQPKYVAPAEPYMHPYYHRYWHHGVQPYYHRFMYRHMRPGFRRHVSYRFHGHRHGMPHHHGHLRNW